MKTSTKGFTIVEVLLVVSIISLLSSVVIVALGSAKAKAQPRRR